MSCTTALAVSPDRRPVALVELRNSSGWAPSIWRRLLRLYGVPEWFYGRELDDLHRNVDALPEWQQAPLVLTADVGVIPWTAYEWAAAQFAEFERRLPEQDGWVNHVPSVIELFRSKPESPFVGVWCTSVTDNPFDPWTTDGPRNGLPLDKLGLLDRHRDALGADWRWAR